MRRFALLTAFATVLLASAALLSAACGDDDDDPGTGPGSDGTATTTATPGNGGGTETPAGGETPAEVTATPGNDAGELGLEGDFDEGWYIFLVTHALLDDSDALATAAAEAGDESGIDASIIRTQAGRYANAAFDGLLMVFLNSSDEIGLPLLDARWCLPVGENPGNTEFTTADLEQQGAVVETAGTVTHDGTDYDLLRYTREIQPGVAFYLTHVQDGDCWVEILVTSREEDDSWLDAVRAFIGTISVT